MLPMDEAQLGAADPFMAPAPPMVGDPMAFGAPTPPMPAPMLPPMGAGQFPSTDPAGLAQVVIDAIMQAQQADMGMLEMQQQYAQTAAQPIIDQMLAMSQQPQPAMGADPMLAYGHTDGAPPMPDDGMMV